MLDKAPASIISQFGLDGDGQQDSKGKMQANHQELRLSTNVHSAYG